MKEKTSMTKREKYIDKLSAKLKEWDRELEEFEKKNEERFSEFKQDMNERLENLKTKRTQLGQKIDRIEDMGEDTYKKIKKDVDKLWKDLKSGFSALRNKQPDK